MKARLCGLALAAGVAFGACTTAAASPQETIHIDIEHSAFEPSRLEIAAGTEVTFLIRNRDPIAHEFIVGNQAVQDIHEEGTEAHHGAKDGEVSVASGEVAMTTYTFEEPGTLIFGCHLPGHYAYGMKGTIEVVD